MKLISYNSDYTKFLWNWYHDYRLEHYFRGYIHGASYQQMANAPQLLQSHILLAFNDENDLSAPIGLVSLADTDPVLRIYKLGALIDPKFQNSGLGHRLLMHGLDYAFLKMNAEKVIIEIVSCDDKQTKGALEFGFIFEGTRRQSVYLNGKKYDEKIYSLLREEYEAL